jgi:hypothetical protein
MWRNNPAPRLEKKIALLNTFLSQKSYALSLSVLNSHDLILLCLDGTSKVHRDVGMISCHLELMTLAKLITAMIGIVQCKAIVTVQGRASAPSSPLALIGLQDLLIWCGQHA